MFVVLWEFDVKPGCERRFETVYGPSGDWVKLFQSDPAYRGTHLLRDPFRERIYITCDFWVNQKDYDAFRQSHWAAYQALDNACAELTITERRLGAFEQVAEDL